MSEEEVKKHHPADTNGDGNNDEHVYPTGKVRAHDTQFITHIPLEDLDSNIYVKLDAGGEIDLTKIKQTLDLAKIRKNK